MTRLSPPASCSLLSKQALVRLVAVAVALVPLTAAAHTGGAPHEHGTLASLTDGFVHPFTGLDHLVAMVALGLWSAMTTRRAWLAPVAFAAALWVGALIGMTGTALPAVEPMIATSLLVVGLLVATGQRLPLAAGAVLAAGFALFHGAAHGAELAGEHASAALAGMVAATALLHAAGVAIGGLLRERSRWWPRVAGAAVALFGAALLAPLA